MLFENLATGNILKGDMALESLDKMNYPPLEKSTEDSSWKSSSSKLGALKYFIKKKIDKKKRNNAQLFSFIVKIIRSDKKSSNFINGMIASVVFMHCGYVSQMLKNRIHT